MRIPDSLSLSAWLSGAFVSLIFGYPSIPSYALGSAVGFLSYAAVYFISRKKLGFGDVKLALFLGGITGIRGWYVANVMASVSGILFYLFFRRSRQIREPVPFAPFLCTSAALVLLFSLY